MILKASENGTRGALWPIFEVWPWRKSGKSAPFRAWPASLFWPFSDSSSKNIHQRTMSSPPPMWWWHIFINMYIYLLCPKKWWHYRRKRYQERNKACVARFLVRHSRAGPARCNNFARLCGVDDSSFSTLYLLFSSWKPHISSNPRWETSQYTPEWHIMMYTTSSRIQLRRSKNSSLTCS